MKPLQIPEPTEEELTALDELYHSTRKVRLRSLGQPYSMWTLRRLAD